MRTDWTATEFRPSTRRFPRSSLHTILRDRSYIGEVQHRGQWYPGKHEPLVDRTTWNRAQALLCGHVYRSHELTYAGEVVFCGHCGHPITGEQKTKKSSTGGADLHVLPVCQVQPQRASSGTRD
ncbi:MAG: recombinase family protein [Planctomycetaceae bacterium]